VIAKVKELFKGHNNLIEEFNAFLPPGYKIEVEPEPSNQADLEHARNYVRKIKVLYLNSYHLIFFKNRFALQPHIYKTFLEILHSYYQGQHQINEVLEEVGDLFQNHPDLLEEFRLFLPKSVSEGGPTAVAAAQKKLLPKKVPKPRVLQIQTKLTYEGGHTTA
jgi:paired amphipathic helix protein Sin3a